MIPLLILSHIQYAYVIGQHCSVIAILIDGSACCNQLKGIYGKVNLKLRKMIDYYQIAPWKFVVPATNALVADKQHFIIYSWFVDDLSA